MTDALEKRVNELMAEGERSKERDRCIAENFWEKILNESETVSKRVDTIIKDQVIL